MNAAIKPFRIANHPIADQFLGRWSPRAFTETTLTEAEVLTVLEAARWAPSASNNQPWRFVWGLRGDAGFAAIAEALVPFNRAWAEKAAALIVIASKTTVTRNDAEQPNPWHAFETGTAWGHLALQAHLMGLAAHAMGGFDAAVLAKGLGLPEGHDLHAVVAVGHPGDPATLPEALSAREVPSLRRPLAELAGHGRFA